MIYVHSAPQRGGTEDEMQDDVTELALILAELGQTDRDLYREIRAEAWAIVQRRHGKKTDAERAAWLASAS